MHAYAAKYFAMPMLPPRPSIFVVGCHISSSCKIIHWRKVRARMMTGDVIHLSHLGTLNKHPGFDGPKGSKKGFLSLYFSQFAAAAKADVPWALRMLETFLVGTTTKEVKLNDSQPAPFRGEEIDLNPTAIPAWSLHSDLLQWKRA